MLGVEPPLTDHAAWLAYNKKKWKLQRKERYRLQAMGISTTSVKSRRGGLGNYFEKQSVAVSRTHWEIVQIVETDEPGMMRVWALVAGDLHCMKVRCDDDRSISITLAVYFFAPLYTKQQHQQRLFHLPYGTIKTFQRLQLAVSFLVAMRHLIGVLCTQHHASCASAGL